MKKLLLTLFTILITTTAITAQQQMNRQKIKVLKTAYITDALSLTQKEAEKFWPVYNLYSDKIQVLRMELEGGFNRKIQLAGGLENISESQAKKFIDEIILNEKQISENEIALINGLYNVISAKKIISLKKAEREFNRRILQEYGNRRRQQGE